MKKILFGLSALALLITFSCSKNDPGIQPPANFGTSPAPTAAILLGRFAFMSGDTVSPTAIGNNIGSMSWDFGDASSLSTSPTPRHIYLTNGTYYITLNVYTADHSRHATARQKIVVGHRYFDSAQCVQIPITDSATNSGWNTGFAQPNIGFAMLPTALSKTVYWTHVPFTGASGILAPRPISWQDSNQVIELTPVTWTFTLLNMVDPFPTGAVSVMHQWKHNVAKDVNYPMVITAPAQYSGGGQFLIKIYWHSY